ncbi:hypothetical protein QTP86_008387 [Hemibagrus guttatus]|nr:hypothetical protein QTP86_008387 [Hemibagrus guttatus]
MMKATVLIGTFDAAEIFLYPSPDLCLDTILSLRSTHNSLDFMAWGKEADQEMMEVQGQKDKSEMWQNIQSSRERQFSGESGLQGLPGQTGSEGKSGTKGDKGPEGPVGVSGNRGLQGLPGPNGDPGPRGTPGHKVGCELEEKERFWRELDEVMESIPTGERVVIGADFNGHVGEGNRGDEEVMGKFGVKERNLEGQTVVDFAKRMDMAVVNTYFQKREEHRVTYKSGGRRTQVDYILCRRGNLKEISDCKVVVGESVARQHRMVVCRMTFMVCKKKRSKIEKKTKWWKLKKEECCEEFRQKLRQALGGQVALPDDWETTAEVIRETGRKVLGVSSGRRKEDKETWWWNEEVQDSVQRKRLVKKKWDMDRTEDNRQEYKELQRRVKREVSKAKQKAYDELYTRLDTREGEKDLYRLARQRDRDGKDVQQVRVIKDRDGRVLTSEESVQRRWKEYFEELMNEENEREKRVEGVNSVEQKVDKIRKVKVRKALKRMKSGKAVGPDDIPVEVWKCLGEAAVEFLTSLFNRVLESERMPEE